MILASLENLSRPSWSPDISFSRENTMYIIFGDNLVYDDHPVLEKHLGKRLDWHNHNRKTLIFFCLSGVWTSPWALEPMGGDRPSWNWKRLACSSFYWKWAAALFIRWKLYQSRSDQTKLLHFFLCFSLFLLNIWMGCQGCLSICSTFLSKHWSLYIPA